MQGVNISLKQVPQSGGYVI